ncbi:MAG: cbb3-type cytochrome c oxidase subunit I [Verrucomicrobiae bacterium]|nr:cbb3-type cytochrome c oxidase subunit I [Verrucomicrobiae bacterium]
MTSPSSSSSPKGPKAALADALDRAAIDASCRLPVLLFFGSAIAWLLVGSVFALLAAIKLTTPEFLADHAWLTFGRVRPAHLNAVAYGWSSTAAIGVAIWLMARLCRVPLRHARILVAAAVLWNLGVAIGVTAILAGASNAIEWLEFPTYAAFILFVSYAFIAVWAVLMFRERRPGHVYVSQWYIFGAFFWFPWLYSVVNSMLVFWPVQGSVQAIINWWFGHNVLGLWFTPIALASTYYMIPKILGKPIHSYYLSILGFWSLALFYSWNGGHHLLGGPIPAWLQSASIVASVMMLIPVITTAINFHMTMRGSFALLRTSPALRFTVFGAMCYTVVSAQGSSMALRSLNKLTHFTHYTIGHAHLGMYAFFTMTMFGAMYYITPRLVRWEWPSAFLIKAHFWLASTGILLMVVSLTLGGLIQGIELENPKVPFLTIVAHTIPWLHARSWSGALLTTGHLAFALSFVLILLRTGKQREGPTLFTKERSFP